MTKVVTVLAVLCLMAPLARAQSGLNFTPNFTPSEPPGFGASGERGIALGNVTRATGGTEARLVVVDRDANQLRFLSPTSGNQVAVLPTSSLSGGFYNVNDASVTTDGAIVVCNLTLNASTSAFKCYSAPDDDGPFDPLIDYTSASADRLGDKITAVGSLSGGTLSVYAASGGAGRVYRFDSGAFASPTIVSVVQEDGSTAITSLGSTPSVGPVSTGSSDFWVNGNGINPMKFSASGQRIGTVSLVGTGSNAIRAISEGGHDFVATFEYNDGAGTSYARAAVVDVTGFPATPSLYDRGIDVDDPDATSGNGDIEVMANGDGTYTICVLGANNGVGCSVTNAAPLPVELVAFSGVAAGEAAMLRWTTAGESNNAGFSIERQTTAGFEAIGFVAGQGTTSERSDYHFEVPTLAPGTHVFRLVQRDFDGATWTSPEVAVEIAPEATFMLAPLHPNPAAGFATARLYLATPQPVRAEVFDLQGRLMQTLHEGLMPEGTTDLQVDASALPAGLYLLRVADAHRILTAPLTVLR